MKNLIFLLSFFFLLVVSLNARETINLDEKGLLKLMKDNPPTLQSIEASYLGSELADAQTNDAFAPILEASTTVVDSDEKALNSFVPVTTKYKTLMVQVTKPLKYGASVGVKGFTEKSTNNFLTNATTTGYGVSLGVDLYRDFLGRTSRSNLELAEKTNLRANLEKEIQFTGFKNNLRKLYWTLVANNEALKITKTLLASSEKQLADANKRYRSGVADKGELARYRSQISSRKASLISLRWEKSQIQQQIKLLLPQLAEKEIELSSYNIDQTVAEVLSCSAMIRKFNNAPMDFTKWDEVVSYLNQEEAASNKVIQTYDDVNLKFIGEYESTGKAFSGSDSLDDLKDDGRGSLTVGLKFSMPLGSSKNKSRTVRELVNKKTYGAKRQETLGKVNAYHAQTIKSVELLNEIVQNQKDNTKHLSESLQVSRKKFRQARISVQQLVQEQDAYLQSNLDEISTKLAVINLLLDYFNVFTDTPCDLNRTL